MKDHMMMDININMRKEMIIRIKLTN